MAGPCCRSGITPYYMSLVVPDQRRSSPCGARSFRPTGEFVRVKGEADDPLDEDHDSPVPGLVHRYPDRVLLLALDFCSTYCRYCTRSRVVGTGKSRPANSGWKRPWSTSGRRRPSATCSCPAAIL